MVAAGVVGAPAAACAAVVPGATYSGLASDGASVTFTISSDGTIVESYEIQGVHGTDVNGNGCTIYSQGNEGVWPGAQISGGAFDYSIGSPTEFDFAGTFPGAQSASGTFYFDNPAVGSSTGCATGTVPWTATATNQVGRINCQSQDGKISGRGATLQLWLQYTFMGVYTSDVCGGVAADASADAIGNGSVGVEDDVTAPGSALYNLANGTEYGRNWMIDYNNAQSQALGSSGANAATGSGAGQTAIGCDAVAFGGSDIPVTEAQYNSIEAPPTASGANWVSNGKNCDPSGTAGGLDAAFSPLPLGQNASGTPAAGTADSYPNPGDTFTGQQLMAFPVGISSVGVFANLPTTCTNANATTRLSRLSTADMTGIWGGTFTNWNQVTIYTGVAACNIPIIRVVRSDNSGTTQSFDNYVADAFGYSTATCDTNAAHDAQTFGQLQNNQVANGSDAYWPGTGGKIPAAGGTFNVAGCNTVEASSNAGGPALIDLAETINGAVGYADYSDTQHDTNNFVSSVSGNTMKVESVQNSNATTSYSSPISGKAANCVTTNASLPGGSGDSVNLVEGSTGGDWDLTAQSAPNAGPDDIAFAAQGSSYPVCSLTWDFVWAGEDGNTPSAPTAAGLVTLPATQVPISSVAGLPDQGSFDVDTGTAGTTTNDGSPQPAGSSTNVTLPVSSLELASTAGMPFSGTVTLTSSTGPQTLSYAGIDGNVLTGVTGGTGTVASNGAAVTVPQAQAFTYTGIGTGTSADAGTVTVGGGTTGAGCTTVAAPCLTGVSGPASGSIASGATLIFPQGTGGPEANLTADQRRTEYSYYTYLMSPEAQSKAAGAFYTSLPSQWLGTILGGIQGNY